MGCHEMPNISRGGIYLGFPMNKHLFLTKDSLLHEQFNDKIEDIKYNLFE